MTSRAKTDAYGNVVSYVNGQEIVLPENKVDGPTNMGPRTVNASKLNVYNLNEIAQTTGDLTINGDLTFSSPGRITDNIGNYWDWNTGMKWTQKLFPGDGSAVQSTTSLEYLASGHLKINNSLDLTGALYPGGQTTRYVSDDGVRTYISAGLAVNGNVYPGGQTTRYILDNGSKITISSSLLVVGGVFPNNQSTRSLTDDGTSLVSDGQFRSTSNILSGGVLYPGGQTTRGFGDSGSNLVASGGLVVTGNLYPGNQTTRYLTDDGSDTKVSSGFYVGGNIRVDGILKYGTVFTSGASGALPNPTKYIGITNAAGSVVYYIPIYTNFNAWTA